MKISDWHVMEQENKHHSLFYGDLSEFDEDDLEGLIEVPYKKWNIGDFTEILGSMLEDDNRHSMTSLGSFIVSMLEKANISEEQQLIVIKNIVEHYSEYHSLNF